MQHLCKILTFVDISSKRAQFIRDHPPSPCGLPTSLKLRQDKSEGRLVTPLRPSGYGGQAGRWSLVTCYSSLVTCYSMLGKKKRAK